MSIESKAKKVAKYAGTLDPELFYAADNPAYKHMGAIILDGVLQAGLNYDNVVLPRVERFRKRHPDNKTVSDFVRAARKDGWEEVCGWKHETKLGRIRALAEFLQKQKVETVADFRKWGKNKDNLELLRTVPGVGPKTRDYLLQRAGVPMVAVDRHLENFLCEAGVDFADYREAVKIIAAAGKILKMNSGQIDGAIWRYMARSKSV